MSDATDFLNKFNTFISKLFFPLMEFENEEDILILFREIGIDINSAPALFNDLSVLIGDMANIVDEYENTDEGTDDENLHKSIFEIVLSSITVIKSLSEEAENLSSLSAGDIFICLLDYLFCHHLQEEIPILFEFLIFCGITEVKEKTLVIDGEDHVYLERKIEYSGIFDLLTDPLQKIRDVYSWDSDDVNVSLLLDRISDLLAACDVMSDYNNMPIDINNSVSANIKDFDINNFEDYNYTIFETKISLVNDIGGLDLCVYPLYSTDGVKCNGTAIGVGFNGEINIEIPLSDNLQIKINSSASLDNGFGLVLRKDCPITFFQNFLNGNASLFTNGTDFSLLGKLVYGDGDKDERNIILGCSDGSYLSTDSATLSVGLLKTKNKPIDIFVELQFLNCEILITAKDSDGFISKILGDEEIIADFDFCIGWSSIDGLYFRGSSALDIVIPVHKSLGPIYINDVNIGIGISEDGIKTNLASSFSVELGPLTAAVDRIGLSIPITFSPDNTGNLGPVDVPEPDFLPPTGIGLSVDGEGLVGGGFIRIDHDNKSYSGALALAFGEISITAIGIIETKLPDGKKGSSTFVSICAEFAPHLDLSYGFKLIGVGGLVGINRTMVTEVLQRGIKNHTLDSILFPDPDSVVANASSIISNMSSAFPAQEGRFIIGPMLKIGWGVPIVISGELGLFMEFPFNPFRGAIMGQLWAAYPSELLPTIQINLEVLGTFDESKKEITFQASFFDSKMFTFPCAFTMTGDAAFLLYYGSNPDLIMAMGGFHPKFDPPPDDIFDDLRRIQVTLTYYGIINLACKGYIAVTTNTLQFGSAVEIYVDKDPLNIGGSMGFDALFYFNPFSVVISFSSYIWVKVFSVSLVDIYLTGDLSGPNPWFLSGEVKINILGADITESFNIPIGQHQNEIPKLEDPYSYFIDALKETGNWSSRLPYKRNMAEILRTIDEDEDTPDVIIVHPSGRLEIRQNIAPLNMTLKKFGNAKITGHDYLTITGSEPGKKLDGSQTIIDPEFVKENFARAQFEEFVDLDKLLSLPSFEKMDGGVTTASSQAINYDAGYTEEKKYTYESILINPDLTSKTESVNGKPNWDYDKKLMAGSAARLAIGKGDSSKRFIDRESQSQVEILAENYLIVNAEDLIPVELSEEINVENFFDTRTRADQILEEQIRLTPGINGEILVIPEYEIPKEGIMA